MAVTEAGLLTADELLRLDSEGNLLDGLDVLPGFTCPVSTVFDV